MASLERHEGHFYNWYDTRTLRPLPPRYISSVDSGNLAGHMLTLRAGLLVLPDQKIISQRFSTASSTRSTCWQAICPILARQRGQLQALLRRRARRAPRRCRPSRRSSSRWQARRKRLLLALMRTPGTTRQRGRAALVRQARDVLDDLHFIAPWLELPAAPSGLREFADLDRVPSLGELAGDAAGRLAGIDSRLGRKSLAKKWTGSLGSATRSPGLPNAPASHRDLRTAGAGSVRTCDGKPGIFVRPGTPSAGDRIQRRRAPSGHEIR